MTHHPIQVLEDGTRVYSNRTRYRPKPAEERKYGVRKPAQEGWTRWRGVWLHPLDFLPLAARSWPETRPDTDAYLHASKARCRCKVCLRPEAQVWRLRGLRSEPAPACL